VTLSIRGHVLTAEPVPQPVAPATVGLWQFKGLTSSERIVHTTTDQTGSYQLNYSFTSICQESDRLLYWVEASAAGHETTTTFSNDDPTLPTWPSDPPIYCSTSPQTIDLVMQPFGALRATTVTNGSPLDPDGYLLRVGGEGPGAGGVHYAIGVNGELVVPELRPGLHSLELVEVAGNCAVAGDNPRTVTVAARQETVSTFQVTCAP
jgi:hypothetical protein